MHRIVAAHLREFSESRGFANESESKQFEEFATYCVLLGHVASTIDPESLTTGDGDSGVDGLAVVMDEAFVPSDEAAREVFTQERRNHDVRFIAVQAKSGERFEKGEILKFTNAVETLFTNERATPRDELEQETVRMLSTVIENANRVRGGKPAISAYFITTGKYSREPELEALFVSLREKLSRCGSFGDIEVGAMGREELLQAWQESVSEATAQITLHSCAPLPKIADIEESYLAVVKAREFVERLLLDEDKKLRSFVFNENVRAFLGEENPINEQIRKTIASPSKNAMFPVLNNGITVISSDVVVQGTTATFKGLQIVNGCQTSHVLYLEREELTADMMVNLKIVETSNTDVISDLVRATNSQSAVDRAQFYSLNPIAKSIEAYFNSFDEGGGRIYFERRERQYFGKGIPAIRVFNLTAAAKGVTAMFIERPDLSFRYQKQMFDTLGDRVFAAENREIVYYAACLVLYRIHLLVGSGTIPQNTRRYKWHLLPIVRVLVSGEDTPSLDSRKVEPYCLQLVRVFSETGDESTTLIRKSLEILKAHTALSEAALKRATIGRELRQQAAKAVAAQTKKKAAKKATGSKKKVSPRQSTTRRKVVGGKKRTRTSA